MKETYFHTIKRRVVMAVTRLNDQAEERDINRNHANYGEASALIQVIKDMGHEADLPAWEDEGCLKVPFIEIDGEKIMEFEKGKRSTAPGAAEGQQA